MSSIVINPESGRRKVRWVIAHFPVELFVRTAKAFVKELEQLCPNQFEIEILTLGGYINKYQDLYTQEELDVWNLTTPHIPGLENTFRTIKDNSKHRIAADFNEIKKHWELVFRALKDGRFEMSQTQVSIIGSHLNPNFHAIDLPFLFNSHDHVSKALDGEIGDRLCADLSAKSGVAGLGFTYSGGYRIVGSTDGITSLSDLSNKKFITATASSHLLFGAAGVKHLTRGTATATDVGDIAEEGGALETTYLRFEGKNVLRTNHSMFMTTILSSNDFLNSLTAEQQEAFKIAAKRVAKIERLWSVEDAAKYEAEAESRGVKIVDISEEERQLLKKSANQIYRKSTLDSAGIDSSIVHEIIKMGYEMDKSHYLH